MKAAVIGDDDDVVVYFLARRACNLSRQRELPALRQSQTTMVAQASQLIPNGDRGGRCFAARRAAAHVLVDRIDRLAIPL